MSVGAMRFTSVVWNLPIAEDKRLLEVAYDRAAADVRIAREKAAIEAAK